MRQLAVRKRGESARVGTPARTTYATLGQRFDEQRILRTSAPTYDEFGKAAF